MRAGERWTGSARDGYARGASAGPRGPSAPTRPSACPPRPDPATEEVIISTAGTTTWPRPDRRDGTVGDLAAALHGFGPGIDDPAGYDPQTTTTPVPQPGVLAFRDLVLGAFPGTGSLGIVRPATAPGRSEHKEGRAWDWKVCRDTQREPADALLSWLLAADRHGNPFAAARRFGIMYVIWDSRIWAAYAADQGWRPYAGPNPHTDHVHFSFSRRGASGETSWWSGRRG